MKKIPILYIALLLFVLFQIGCTEPFEIENQDYENVLVVESTITNENKQQTVKLSRTSTLENQQILIENNASVQVMADNGETFSFSQDDETGFYVSDEIFSAQPNVQYTLNITTKDGKKYSSSPVALTPHVEMDKVYAERVVNPVDNKDGVQVLVDTDDPTGKAKYFRYEYEETYKIEAPYPSPYTFEIVNFNASNYTFDVNVMPREPEKICYSTEYSKGVLQTATTELNENRVFRFPVKYLSKNDPKLQTRYSVLIKQYVQDAEAYTFYKMVHELGNIQSLLSQAQPGFVIGNVKLQVNPDEKVLGFFEVSSITSQRLYFNYEDFDMEKPPYFIECEKLVLDYRDNTTFDDDPNEREVIFTRLSYYNYQIVTYGQPNLFTITQAECSVCTSFSSNVKPDFWED